MQDRKMQDQNSRGEKCRTGKFGTKRRDPLGSLSAPPYRPLAVLGGWGPQEGMGREGKEGDGRGRER